MSQVSDFELCNLAYGGHEPLINTRLEEEPNLVDKQDNGGRTALHWASCTNNVDVAKLLISKFNARVNIKDDLGWTALHCATSSGSDEITEILLGAGSSVNAKTTNGQVPLHYVASKNHTHILPMLLSRGAEPDAQDKYGHSPLHRAASKGFDKVIEKMMIQYNPIVDVKDNLGNTPLHMACEEDRLSTAFYLLEIGADPQITNRDEKTPFQLCSDSLRAKLVKKKSRRSA